MEKLNERYVAVTSPLANKGNIVLWKDYRITVLQERLFRIEKSESNRYRDEATTAIWFRDMKAQEFSVDAREDRLAIVTKYCCLVIKNNIKESTITINNHEIKLSNKENLYGTYSTLDGCDGPMFLYGDKPTRIKLGYGVCSKSGVAIIDDTKSLLLNSKGELYRDDCELDEYVFAYGNDYLGAVKALFLISGKTPLVPRFALGNWWSHYHAYTDEDYLTLLTSFEENEIPISVGVLDMDWHYSDPQEIDNLFHLSEEGLMKEKYVGSKNLANSIGWTGYTFNKSLFPNYKEFLKLANKHNVKIGLNLHPASGIRFWEECYVDMATANAINPESKICVPFSIDRAEYVNSYFTFICHPYQNEGVAFWWIDWQQGDKWGKEGINPLWTINHYHYLDISSNSVTPIILSRYGGIGSHRYPVGFSGDTSITWNTLKFLPYFTATSSNIGYTWWSHDIGGHHAGITDPQLYLRFLQFGVFSPINRLHSTNMEVITKKPGDYGNGIGDIAKRWLQFRHAIIPYIYTHDYITSNEGVPLIKPLYYVYPNNKEIYKYRDEYFFGGLLVSPIVNRINRDGYAEVPTWLPEGKWTDIFTDDEYNVRSGGEQRKLYRQLDSIPVLAGEGAILPISMDKGNSIENPIKLEVDIFNGKGEFALYEDNRLNGGCECFFTEFKTELFDNGQDSIQKLTISSRGDKGVVPIDRKIRIVFKNIYSGNVHLSIDGQEVKATKLYLDYVAIEIDFKPFSIYDVSVYFHQDRLNYLKGRALRIVCQATGNNKNKNVDYLKIKHLSGKNLYKGVIVESGFSRTIKSRLLEVD